MPGERRRPASPQHRSGHRIPYPCDDGEIGHVEDFLVEDADWSIHYLVVDTKNWWPGKKVLISPRSARQIDWTDRLVNLDVDRQSVKDSPPYDAATRSIGPMRGISTATMASSARAVGPSETLLLDRRGRMPSDPASAASPPGDRGSQGEAPEARIATDFRGPVSDRRARRRSPIAKRRLLLKEYQNGKDNRAVFMDHNAADGLSP